MATVLHDRVVVAPEKLGQSAPVLEEVSRGLRHLVAVQHVGEEVPDGHIEGAGRDVLVVLRVYDGRHGGCGVVWAVRQVSLSVRDVCRRPSGWKTSPKLKTESRLHIYMELINK